MIYRLYLPLLAAHYTTSNLAILSNKHAPCSPIPFIERPRCFVAEVQHNASMSEGLSDEQKLTYNNLIKRGIHFPYSM